MSEGLLADFMASLRVGDRVRFTPYYSAGNRWWTVRARDERFIICTALAQFEPKGGALMHTLVDLTGWQDHRYNGAGNGIVRSSVNAIGGGWDTTTEEDVAELLAGLQSGEWDLSVRRVVNVHGIEFPR